MRRLTWAALATLGLTLGAGCREREEARPAAIPESERAEARQRLQEQADELADAAARTARAAGEVAKQEATELNERVKEEAPRVHEDLSRTAQDVSQQAREVARGIRTEGSTAAEQAVEDPLTGSVSGTVARASGGALQLHDTDGKQIVLTTDGDTRVTRGGQPTTLRALQPGAEVRASYVIQGENWMARQVEVVAPSKQ
jgi:ElaB/YqjD/DUF883 family membrane-anchored ribosome-binding protein